MVLMAGHKNNKTALTGAAVMPYATSFIGNNDPVFNNVPAVPFTAASAVINTPAASMWQAGAAASLTATVQSPFGVDRVELLLDDQVVATSPTQTASQTFQIDTTSHADGVHTAVVRMTDQGGRSVTATMQVNFDNSPPVSTGVTTPGCAGVPCNLPVISGCASDAGSGVLSVTDVVYGTPLNLSSQGCWSTSHTLSQGNPVSFPFVVRDRTNHCTTYVVDLTISPNNWTQTSSGVCP
jgi:hypothetical protein